MTPQSVGLAGSQLTIGKLSGRRGLQGKLHELGHDLEGEALDTIYRQAIALADAKKEVTDADLLALVEQRASEVPASVELVGWSVTSSHGGNATGTVSLTVRGEDRSAEAHGNGPVDALYSAVDQALQPVLGWHPVLTEYEIKAVSGRRGRPGPGPRPLPALLGRGARGARRVRPRALDEHHRGVDRRLPRGGQQAPRRRDQRRRRRVRRPAHGGRPAVTRATRLPRTDRDDPGRRRRAGRRRGGAARRRRGRRAGSGSRSTGPSTSSAAAAIDAYGVAIRPEDVEACGAADAILLGAVGGPKWSDPSAPVRPEQALFALRGGLGLYANLRPVTVHPALSRRRRSGRSCSTASTS